jgi:type IV pilus assembly protein PilC
MSNYSYVAFDGRGYEVKGSLDVLDQAEAIRRLKEMGYFPTKIIARDASKTPDATPARISARKGFALKSITLGGTGISAAPLSTFTRQMATLLEAGLPITRGLRLLEEQETNVHLRRVIEELTLAIEGGETLSEALSHHPKVFNRLFINMIKAGEIDGVLDIVLKRLADFMEKAQKIKGKVIAALFYPAAVLTVAAAIMGVLLVFVIPKFKDIFTGLLNGRPLPAFTLLILNISDAVKNHIFLTTGALVGIGLVFRLLVSTRQGRRIFDRAKLKAPLIGPVLRKAAISKFARTFGTLVGSGVPILQTLTIVKETSGNMAVSEAVSAVHESVKQGETITTPLKASGIFPAMVVGMIDVGEQTGALPEMLMKVADTYDDQVDNAVASMTSLIEPIMIVLLAVVVGSIVIALFLPIIVMMENGMDSRDDGGSL